MATRPPPPPPLLLSAGNFGPTPAQGQQPFPMPMPSRQPVVSTRYVDLTPRVPLDEDACRKKLTSYSAVSIRKVLPPGQKNTAQKDKDKKDKDKKDKDKKEKDKDKKNTSTWAKCNHTEESWTQEETMKQIKKLNEEHSVTEKKQKLKDFQQSQVNKVLDILKSAENENSFEWSLAQIDQKFQPVGNKKETTVITVYAKRAPRSDLSAVAMYNHNERCKAERMAMINRPPQSQPQPQPQPQSQPQPQPQTQPRPSQGYQTLPLLGGPPINLTPENKKSSGHRKGKIYHRDSSSYSGSTSDTENDSDYSSSENTSISTRSGHRARRYSHKERRSRSRSYSRHREHRRIPYNGDSDLAPPYVPEMPRAIATTDGMNAMFEAGKQAGKIAADAERFAAADRLASTHLPSPHLPPPHLPPPHLSSPYLPSPHSPSPHRVSPHGRAIVSNGYYEPQYPLESHHSGDRYGDDIRLREEERLRREDWARRRVAENYMDRRVHEHTRLVPNPFAPRRHPPSVESGW